MNDIKSAVINASQNSQYFKTLIFEDVLSSTQHIAKDNLDKISSSFLVSTLSQTNSIGRFKRYWESPMNGGFYGSFVFRPNIPIDKIIEFNLFISLAIAKSCEKFSDEPVTIKWPNDIYIKDKKVCGFLTDIFNKSRKCDTIICGIGINIFNKSSNIEKKTALQNYSDIRVDIELFLEILFRNIEHYYEYFLTNSFSSVKKEWLTYSNILGKQMRISTYNDSYWGKVIDIDNQGFLKVVDEFGKIRNIISADIETYGDY